MTEQIEILDPKTGIEGMIIAIENTVHLEEDQGLALPAIRATILTADTAVLADTIDLAKEGIVEATPQNQTGAQTLAEGKIEDLREMNLRIDYDTRGKERENHPNHRAQVLMWSQMV